MIDSKTTKMDFFINALDSSINPHHSGHVHGPLDLCGQPGR